MELSLNTATVRKQWNLAQMIDGCARHGIRGISPWRDQVEQMGLQQAKKSIREKDLVVTDDARLLEPASDLGRAHAAFDGEYAAVGQGSRTFEGGLGVEDGSAGKAAHNQKNGGERHQHAGKGSAPRLGPPLISHESTLSFN